MMIKGNLSIFFGPSSTSIQIKPHFLFISDNLPTSAKFKNQNFILPTPVNFLKCLYHLSYLQIYLTLDSPE